MSQSRFAWLASWPRSGNTWLRMLLEGLIYGGAVDINALRLRVPVASRIEFDAYLGIDSSTLLESEIEAARPEIHAAIAQSFSGPLILRKVHDRCRKTGRGTRVFPPELSLGAVYIIRDPRDVAISFADLCTVSIDEAIRLMGDSATAFASSRHRGNYQLLQPLGSWTDHITGWVDESSMPVHVLRYEDLSAATAVELAKVARFLHLSEENVEHAVAAAAFGKLQAQEAQGGFREKPVNCRKFFRQGRTGAWRDVLSAAQAQQIRRDHALMMTRFGYV